jgi:hypothetical protein
MAVGLCRCAEIKSWFSLKFRVAVEDRLRKMWSQISEEINALAEERSKEDHGCAELVSWMCQVSAVLQEILPTTMGPHGQSTQLETNENRHIVGVDSKIIIASLR